MALMEEDIEFLEDQIVPDQDDLFLPPAEVTWNVSYIIFFMKYLSHFSSEYLYNYLV